MNSKLILACLIAIGLAVPAASAMTVVNSDHAKVKLVYMPNKGKPQHFALGPSHQRSFSCKDGGTLMLGTHEQTCTAKTGKIWIKNGKFVG